MRRRSEYHARLCLARAGNRGFEIIYAYEVSEHSERGRVSTAQALRRRAHHARLCLARAGNRGLKVIYVYEVSERSERGRESSSAVTHDVFFKAGSFLRQCEQVAYPFNGVHYRLIAKELLISVKGIEAAH